MSMPGRRAYMREILREYPRAKKKPAGDRTIRENRLVEIVDDMLAEIERMRDGRHRVELIRLTYFDRSHTLYGAAMTIPISERQAKKWNAIVMSIMAEKMQLL